MFSPVDTRSNFATINYSTFDNCTTVPYTLVKGEHMNVLWSERNIMLSNAHRSGELEIGMCLN